MNKPPHEERKQFRAVFCTLPSAKIPQNTQLRFLCLVFISFALLYLVAMTAAVRKAAGFLIFRVAQGPTIEYLLLQSAFGPRHWTPPKGYSEFFETPLMMAYRETEEETHIKQSQLRVFDLPPMKINYTVNSEPKEVSYFLAELQHMEEPIIISREHQSYDWCDYKTALRRVKYNGMKNLLTGARDLIAELQAKNELD